MRRSMVVAAGAVVLTLGLAACGDDSDDADEPTVEDGGAVDETDDGAGDAGDDAGAGSDVTIANFAFSPDSLTVASGDTVSVTNSDGSGHTFSSDDAGFDESVGAGESVDVTIDAEPGTYDFQCNIHPSMTGTITVE